VYLKFWYILQPLLNQPPYCIISSCLEDMRRAVTVVQHTVTKLTGIVSEEKTADITKIIFNLDK